ncbi:MAG: hypothetical protein IJT16_04560 [Lachnospiraceae bacterium]|nr:hypothetical protein [Lachnospiraceae bacterium]
MQYTDYDLIVLNRLKGAETIGLIGEDVLYFRELIGMVYPAARVHSYGTADILDDGTEFDFILIGDGIISDGVSRNYLYKFISFAKDLTPDPGKELRKDTTILGIAKDTSLNSCCNSFIRCGYEILSSKSVRVREGGEESWLLFELKKHREVVSSTELFSRYRTVYALCPPAIKTGGAELLHQLVYHINQLGGNACITYMMSGGDIPLTHPELEKYVYGRVRTMNEISDHAENALVIPEGWFIGAEMVQSAKKLFWWLSVDNFLQAVRDYGRGDAESELRLLCEKVDQHLYQSEYARDFVEKYNIQGKPVLHLSDYLNDTYLLGSENALTCEKEDLVLYNPAKGREFTEKLIEAAPDIKWTPIERLTTDQVQKLLRTAKVYIDFGNHPGKDRIPREAAVSGCIVITGRKGAAAFKEDVAIPEEYRIDEEQASVEEIIRQIRSCIQEYSTRIGAFEEYRKRVLDEKEAFLEDVKTVFFE